MSGSHNKYAEKFRNFVLMPGFSLEERIFNLLCLVGFFALLWATLVRGFLLSLNMLTVFYLLVAAAALGISLILLNKFHVRKRIISFIMALVLNILFPLIFFTSGGIYSGMTAYFVLSMALFFVLLSGRTCAIMVIWHIAVAMCCYYLSYNHPELITPLRGKAAVYLDSMLAIALSGLIPCLLIKAQTDAYIAEKMKANTAAKARADFLANMSHEIRTPLNAIIGISDIEIRSTSSHEVKKNLRKVHRAGVQLLSIINDILDISKMESGNFEIFTVNYDFASLVLDTASANAAYARKGRVAFKLEISEGIPRSMIGDELNIKQIMNNLLSNAFKYTRKGSVTLKIHSTPVPAGSTVFLHISVSDTGQGIRPEDLEKIFSDYNKLDRQATAVEGIGLGLAICRKLIDMMGGTIEVKSVFGTGSTFTVIIPQQVSAPDPIGLETARRLSGAPELLGRGRGVKSGEYSGRVLVVDDMPINLDIARALLEEHGLDVISAPGGEEALAMLRDGTPHFDLIFMDHMMPGMDGSSTVQAIRALGGDYAANVPIIGLSARERNEFGNDQFLSLVQDIVSKPIDVERLEKMLEKWLKK